MHLLNVVCVGERKWPANEVMNQSQNSFVLRQVWVIQSVLIHWSLLPWWTACLLAAFHVRRSRLGMVLGAFFSTRQFLLGMVTQFIVLDVEEKNSKKLYFGFKTSGWIGVYFGDSKWFFILKPEFLGARSSAPGEFCAVHSLLWQGVWFVC